MSKIAVFAGLAMLISLPVMAIFYPSENLSVAQSIYYGTACIAGPVLLVCGLVMMARQSPAQTENHHNTK